MSDMPKTVTINEEGPREGFQIEPGPISTADKVRFIEALAETGVRQISCVALVNPQRVPGWADADEVARSIRRRPGVSYTGLWLNRQGLNRSLQLPLDKVGLIQVSVSDTFSVKNTNKTTAQTLEEQHALLQSARENEVDIDSAYVMTAFGCNFEGETPVSRVVQSVRSLLLLAEEAGQRLRHVVLADTVGHATPARVERVIGAVRDAWPDLPLGVHFHDTRGMGMANSWAALRMGVSHMDSSCAGLGGCPFAGMAGAAGNICTEELVYMCEDMGVDTGVDLERMIDCARMAEDIVGHPLPSKMIRGFACH